MQVLEFMLKALGMVMCTIYTFTSVRWLVRDYRKEKARKAMMTRRERAGRVYMHYLRNR